jgi:folate-binding protein YgfZ
MSECLRSQLADRGVIRVTGEDAREFLQGLVSNDMRRVAPDRAIYAALLTPQGKYLFDFFIAEADGAFLIDCERARLPELIKRLTIYKLRAKAALENVSDGFKVVALWGGDTDGLVLGDEPGSATAYAGGVAFTDPRLASAGVRLIVPVDATLPDGTDADAQAYDAHRLALGLPDGSRDMVLEKAILLESGFDELNGVDWKKGCYMGQELTARTKYRGLVKKRLVPVGIEGPLPEPGTPVMSGDKEVGELRSGQGGRALALIRLEVLEDGAAELRAGDARVRPEKPNWASF